MQLTLLICPSPSPSNWRAGFSCFPTLALRRFNFVDSFFNSIEIHLFCILYRSRSSFFFTCARNDARASYVYLRRSFMFPFFPLFLYQEIFFVHEFSKFCFLRWLDRSVVRSFLFFFFKKSLKRIGIYFALAVFNFYFHSTPHFSPLFSKFFFPPFLGQIPLQYDLSTTPFLPFPAPKPNRPKISRPFNRPAQYSSPKLFNPVVDHTGFTFVASSLRPLPSSLHGDAIAGATKERPRFVIDLLQSFLPSFILDPE